MIIAFILTVIILTDILKYLQRKKIRSKSPSKTPPPTKADSDLIEYEKSHRENLYKLLTITEIQIDTAKNEKELYKLIHQKDKIENQIRKSNEKIEKELKK